MRKILFRGKPKEGYNYGKDWLHGSLLHIDENNYGIVELEDVSCDENGYVDYSHTPVQLETVSQFTGLTDKNGKEAYSGDVYRDSHGTIRTIWADQGGFRSESNPLSFGYGSQGNSNPSIALADQQTTSWFEGNCEIIGSIHDNPELLTK